MSPCNAIYFIMTKDLKCAFWKTGFIKAGLVTQVQHWYVIKLMVVIGTASNTDSFHDYWEQEPLPPTSKLVASLDQGVLKL